MITHVQRSKYAAFEVHDYRVARYALELQHIRRQGT